MFVRRVGPRFPAAAQRAGNGGPAAAWFTLLLVVVGPLSLPLNSSNNNDITPISQRLLPGFVLLGECSSGSGNKTRSMIGSALWRIRNHPVSEAIVAKSSLLTHGDVYSVSRIAELGNNIGVGFQHMLDWLESLSVPQQVYAWKLFAGTESAHVFSSKFQGAEQLYTEGTSQRVLQRLKFVLLDGKLEIPSTLGVERLLGEAMEAYKAAFFTFAGELSEAISRTNIVGFEKTLQDNLPLLKEVLAGILSLCVRLDDNVTKEYRTTLGRWILKLYRLDTAALLLSPLSPQDQVRERKIVFGLPVDEQGVAVNVLGTSASSDSGAAGGTQQPGDSTFALPPQFAQQMQQQPPEGNGTTYHRTSSAGTFPAAAPAEPLPAPSHGVLPHGAAAPGSAMMPLGETASLRPGTIGIAKFAPSTISDLTRQQSSRSTRMRGPGDTWSGNGFDRRDIMGKNEQAGSSILSGTTSSQGPLEIPGAETMTSMAALLRAEAEMRRSASLQSNSSDATFTTATAGRSDPQESFSFGGHMIDSRWGRSVGVGGTVPSGYNTHVGNLSAETGVGPLLATASRSDTVSKTQKGSSTATLGEGPSRRGKVQESPEQALQYLLDITKHRAVGRGGGTVSREQAAHLQPGKTLEPSTAIAKGVSALRAGTPLSATQLKSRLRSTGSTGTMIRTATQQGGSTTARIGSLDTAAGSTFWGRGDGGATSRQTAPQALDATAAAAVATTRNQRAPSSILHEETGSSNRPASTRAATGGRRTLDKTSASIVGGAGPLVTSVIHGGGDRWGGPGTLPASTVDRGQSQSATPRKGTLPASLVHQGEAVSTLAERRGKEKPTQASPDTVDKILKTMANGGSKTFATIGAPRASLKTSEASAAEQRNNKRATSIKDTERTTRHMSKSALEWGAGRVGVGASIASPARREMTPSIKTTVGPEGAGKTTSPSNGKQDLVALLGGRTLRGEKTTNLAFEKAAKRPTHDTSATEAGTQHRTAVATTAGGETKGASRQRLGERNTSALIRGTAAKVGKPSDSPAPSTTFNRQKGTPFPSAADADGSATTKTLADVAEQEVRWPGTFNKLNVAKKSAGAIGEQNTQGTPKGNSEPSSTGEGEERETKQTPTESTDGRETPVKSSDSTQDGEKQMPAKLHGVGSLPGTPTTVSGLRGTSAKAGTKDGDETIAKRPGVETAASAATILRRAHTPSEASATEEKAGASAVLTADNADSNNKTRTT